MIAITVFWTLILVSLKLLALIIADSFRPLPKPTAKRKPRKSPFLDPLSVTVMAMAKGRGAEDLRRDLNHQLFNNPRTWYSQVLSSGANK